MNAQTGSLKTIGEMGADARAIYQHLIKAAVGDVVTYGQAAKLSQRDVQGRERYVLETARRAAARDGFVFGAVRGVGLKRLADAEIVAEVEDVPGRVRRMCRRGNTKLSRVRDYKSLPKETQVRHNALACQLGALSLMTKPKAQAQIEQAVRTAATALPGEEALKLFVKSGT